MIKPSRKKFPFHPWVHQSSQLHKNNLKSDCMIRHSFGIFFVKKKFEDKAKEKEENKIKAIGIPNALRILLVSKLSWNAFLHKSETLRVIVHSPSFAP